MEETLKALSEYQLEALKKGIAFDIDLYYNSNKVPTARVKMEYSVTGDIAKSFAFDTTFVGQDRKEAMKLENIQYYINTVQH